MPGLVRELGLDGAVTLTGEVPDAGPYVEQFDVLVNASDPEPFGIVLLEGMSRGVAVLAVDSGGPAEFLEHGRTGMLAARASPRCSRTRWSRCSFPTRRREIGGAGRESFMRDSPTPRCASGSSALCSRSPTEPGCVTARRWARRDHRGGSLVGVGRVRELAAGEGPMGKPFAGEVTIVAHDIGPVRGMERQLSELIVGSRDSAIALP